jgi:ribokinase
MEAADNTASANIVVVGSLMVDHIIITNRLPEIDETYPANSYHQALGGKGANSAIATYRSCHKKPLAVEQRKTTSEAQSSDQTETETPVVNGLSGVEPGIEVQMVGAVGDDEHGAVFRNALADNGIDASGVRTVPGKRTAMTFITVMEESRDNRVLFVAGATEALLPEHFTKVEDFSSTGKPDLIISQLELSTKTVEQMLETAGAEGIDFLLNAAPASNILSEKYCYITHLIVNKTEAAILSGLDLADVKEENWGDMAQNFLAEGIQNVVITVSAEGAFYANKHGSGHVRAFKVHAIDPTGAGLVSSRQQLTRAI